MQIPEAMRAMVLDRPRERLVWREVPVPRPAANQVLIRVEACGVCRTDLHLVDGELPEPKLPVIPGHEIVGRIVEVGNGISTFRGGERVIRSVANLTRRDGEELLALAPKVPVRTTTTVFALAQANAALDGIRHGTVAGAAVLAVASPGGSPGGSPYRGGG